MRTKALLLTAAVGAMTVASTLAQVYSVNVVGFVNVNLAPGFNFLSNPLKATADTVGAVLPVAGNLPDGTTVATWNKATQTFNNSATVFFGDWDDPTYALPPGEAFFINLAGTQAKTVTFVGEVRQGTLSTPLVIGFNMVGSQVAQAGSLGDEAGGGLGYVSSGDGDTAATWNSGTQMYNNASTVFFGNWDSPVMLGMAEGVVVTRAAAGNWTRTFNVQ